MTEPRLASHIWVAAHIRRLQIDAIPAMLVRRGQADAGQVMVKLNTLGPPDSSGVTVFVPSFDIEKGRVWRVGIGPVPEAEADAYLARAVKIDPDLWILEIEDAAGRHGLEPLV